MRAVENAVMRAAENAVHGDCIAREKTIAREECLPDNTVHSNEGSHEKEEPVELRKAQMVELDHLMDIYADGRRALAELGIDQWQSGRPSVEMIADDIERGEFYLCVDDGVIAGAAMLGLRGDADYDLIKDSWLTDCTVANPDYLVVHRVVADSRLGRRGVASFLITAAEQMAREAGRASVRIDTHPGNVRMHGLLAKLGYTEVGVFLLPEGFEATRERVAYEKLVG